MMDAAGSLLIQAGIIAAAGALWKDAATGRRHDGITSEKLQQKRLLMAK
jgi:hypothetical protein